MIDVTSVDGPQGRAAAATDDPAAPGSAAYPPGGAAYPPGGADHSAGGWPAGVGPVYSAPEPDRLTRFVLRLQERTPRWVVPLAALGCVGAGIGYTLLFDPTRSAPDAAPTCLLKLTTGLDCPGCGGTRALWYVLHADLPAAARHHVLLVFALPFLAYLFVAWAGRQAFGWRLPELRIGNKLIGAVLAVWFAFSVVRNLPWAPFTAFYV
ncbi:DUF2752 domain-containing protein [Salinispora arenicola]|uniref:DUF2752 domain-containing protein n=1 Tax=Salinispora arenicola TaxID=168697 RepID=UPI00207A430A|nr:DUF2752 domain-containing protein [Salinispora arenicola]MCN0180742.1 DUF2752 domain-containing protein [Salinispora arenicola]